MLYELNLVLIYPDEILTYFGGLFNPLSYCCAEETTDTERSVKKITWDSLSQWYNRKCSDPNFLKVEDDYPKYRGRLSIKCLNGESIVGGETFSRRANPFVSFRAGSGVWFGTQVY